jgi:hypothetical protein
MYKDIIGKKFGKLTAIEHVGINKHRKSLWLCRCECGNITTVVISKLTSESTKSCGCLATTHGLAGRINGKVMRLYTIWSGIKRRCMNKNNKDYSKYGGRGIKICKEWIGDFKRFHDWAIKNGYNDLLTIDRKNVNGNYEPLNCRWATQKVQSNNKTNNIVLNYKGESNTVTEWADKLNFNPESIRSRLSRGWTISEALTIPINKI